MARARELRGLVPVEVAIVLAAAIAGLATSLPIPVVILLLAAASLSLWVRGRSFALVTKGPPLYALIGLGAGLAALALSLVVGTPIVERATDHAVQWSMYPIVRGSPMAFATIAMLVGLGAIAAELVLRGWIVERVLELSQGNVVLAILVGAIAEALVTDGDVTMRIGAGVFGLAMGWMYVAAGRSVVAPICARLAFSLGALSLEALRLVG